MSWSRRADWAATAPWKGITGKPTGPDGELTVNWGNIKGSLSNQADLVAALAAKVSAGELARVAFTGQYSDLIGAPSILGGINPITPGVQSYFIPFSPAPVSTPKIVLEVLGSPDEIMWAMATSINTGGCNIVLSAVPSIAAAVFWEISS